MATTIQTNKIGRNSLCLCGNGKKYKKCCSSKAISAGAKTRQVMEHITKKFSNQKIKIADSKTMGLDKMSEIMLEYSGYLLSNPQSQEKKEEIITLAVIAWNISLSYEDHADKIREYLSRLKFQEYT